MVDDEENQPRKHVLLEKPPLDRLNVADLHAYIVELKSEIARAEAAIAAKQGARGDADRFFKFNKG